MKNTVCCLIAVLAFAVFNIAAQESKRHLFPKSPKGEKVKVEKKDMSCVSDTVSLHVKCDSLIMQNNALKNQVDSLKRVLVMREEMLVKQDSIINIHEDRMNFVDTCMIKLCNIWLYEPYCKEAVDDAIKYFNRIISPQLKEDFGIVLQLLKDYEHSYFSFQDIVIAAQNDNRRFLETRREEYATHYIAALKKMEYYQKYYNSSWNIRYLTKQIKRVIEMLEIHKSTEKTADFSAFIDKKKEEVSNGATIGD